MVNPTQLVVELAPLDPAFKGNLQDFATHLIQRVRISSPSGIVTFVVGDTQPLFNAGPWLKNGTAWWVWDEVLKTYIPLDISDSTLAAEVDRLTALFNAVFDNNGRLRDGTVWRTECLADRIVTQPKLHWNSCFYVLATGVNGYSANLLNSDGSVATPTFGDGITDSLAIFVKFQNANTGASTFSLNGGTAYPIVVGTGTPLVGGNIEVGRIYQIVFDGTSWQIMGFDPATGGASVVHPSALAYFKVTSVPWNLFQQLIPAAWSDVPLTDLCDPNSMTTGFAGYQITLPAGSYEIFAHAKCAGAANGAARLRLYNVTAGTEVVDGGGNPTCLSNTSFVWGATWDEIFLIGQARLAGTTTISLQMIALGARYLTDTCSDTGVGSLARLQITKL